MISIIIVHYKVKKELFRCIDSIIHNKKNLSIEIIVVDNDEIKTIKPDLLAKFPDIVYIPNENKGFGHGCNRGAEKASGNYLFFLNPDAEVYPDCLEILSQFLDSHKKYAVVAPLIQDKDGKALKLQGGKILTPFNAIFTFSFMARIFSYNKIYKSYWLLEIKKEKDAFDVEAVPGTAFMIRREIFRKTRGFDENFFLYFEETDLCKRLIDKKYHLAMHPLAKIFHLQGSSTRKSKIKLDKVFRESRFYYLRKHFGFMNALLAEFFLRTSKKTILRGMFLSIVIVFISSCYYVYRFIR